MLSGPELMRFHETTFAGRFGITATDLENCLSAALAKGGDYADIFLEYSSTFSISLEESALNNLRRGTVVGAGIRVIKGERSGYAHTDDLSLSSLRVTASAAGFIARAGGGPPSAVKQLDASNSSSAAYPCLDAAAQFATEALTLARRADIEARAADLRVERVQISCFGETREVAIATSRGELYADLRPLSRIRVRTVIRTLSGKVAIGQAGCGGRYGIDMYSGQQAPEALARDAVRRSLVQSDAVPAPRGELTVVLGPGWPGILVHEAVGHGLEADYNRRRLSAYSGRIGQRVASPLCTIVDDGTIWAKRGSLAVDDEGVPTRQNVLIEKGVLCGYLSDRLSGRVLGNSSTGSGRRQSYQHVPMPRMSNTFMLAGESDPEEIVRSVKHGLYCANFGEGQVDITSGNFVFHAVEAYFIEDGRLGAPVRNVMLIGNGPQTLEKVSMVGTDLRLDQGLGTCSKEGQNVPITVGIPTIKIDSIAVGGTR